MKCWATSSWNCSSTPKIYRCLRDISNLNTALQQFLFLVSTYLSILGIFGQVLCLSGLVSLPSLPALCNVEDALMLDLSKKINPSLLDPDVLVGKYIPNLVAKPFGATKEYAQLIYDQTSSPRLDKVLKKWDQERWASPEQRQKLAYTIFVELLSY